MSERNVEPWETALDKEIRSLRCRVIALERKLKGRIGAAAFEARMKGPATAGNVVRLRPRGRVT